MKTQIERSEKLNAVRRDFANSLVLIKNPPVYRVFCDVYASLSEIVNSEIQELQEQNKVTK